MPVSEHAEKLADAVGTRRYTTGKMALSPGEARRVLESARTLQHKALLASALSTGARRADIVTWERDRLEWVGDPPDQAARVRFWEGKKGRPWSVWVVPDLAEPLRLHLENLDASERWVFPSTQNDGHVGDRTVHRWLKWALEDAGLEARPFHALRATAMKLLLRAGWSIEQVMEQTGDSWETVQAHYTTPSRSEMAKSARETRLLENGGGAE